MKNNFCLLFSLIILINACSDSGDPISSTEIGDEIEIPGCTDPEASNYDPNATDDDNSCEYLIIYSTQIQPIFNNNCTGCHGSSGGLSLSNYESVMAGTSNNGPIIIPGEANNSLLVQKIIVTPDFGSRMPLNNPTYFDNQEIELQLIIDWINQGANND